jgi:O-antigen/teichoic acid export membrane protein
LAQIVDITRGSLVHKLLRHGSLYFVANVIMRFVGLLLIPLDTRLFTPDEYGTIVTLTSVTRVMVVFVGLYLDAAFNRFYHEYKHNPFLLRSYTSTLYWFIMAWGLLVVVLSLLVVGLIIRPSIPVWPVFVLAFLGPLFTQLGLLSQAHLQQNHRSGLQVTVTLCNLALNIGVMLLAVGVFRVGMAGKFIGIFCGTGLSFVLGTYILRREGYLHFTFSRPMLCESLRFSVPLIPNIAAGWIAGFSDRILLSMYGPIAETGVYNVGYSLGMGFSLFSQSVFMVYGPMIYAMMKKDTEVTRQRIERFVPYYFMLMLWLCLALSLFAPETVRLLTPAEYAGATTIVPVVVFAYFLGSQYQTAVVLLSALGKTGLISTGAILQALVNLALNLLLLPRFGKTAAAWTTVAAIGTYTAWMVYWSQRSFCLKLDLRRIALAVLAVGAMALLYLVLGAVIAASWLGAVVVKLGLLVGAVLTIWFFGGIEPVDKTRLKMRIRGLLARYVEGSM